MGQAVKMASVPRVGWAHASEGGRWSWGQGCLLPAHWLALSPRMALALGDAPLAGSRREAQEREQAARPPACTGCV